MDARIKIDYEKMETSIDRMGNAYRDYNDKTQNGFTRELEALDNMNADFVEKLIRVLEISEDWEMKELSTEMKEYIKAAQTICKEIKATDESLAGK